MINYRRSILRASKLKGKRLIACWLRIQPPHNTAEKEAFDKAYHLLKQERHGVIHSFVMNMASFAHKNKKAFKNMLMQEFERREAKRKSKEKELYYGK